MDNIKSNEKKPQTGFECVCGKVYKYNSGLSKHRKKCTLKSKEENNKNTETVAASSSAAVSAEMLNKLVEQNNTLMEKVIELSKDRQVIKLSKLRKQENDNKCIFKSRMQECHEFNRFC